MAFLYYFLVPTAANGDSIYLVLFDNNKLIYFDKSYKSTRD